MLSLSLVFQGPVTTEQGDVDMSVVENILVTRRHCPLAEIVISTWQQSAEVQATLEARLRLAGVRWVWNRDPGPIEARIRHHHIISNINRLRMSSCEGVRGCTGEVVVKLRTDCRLENTNLLRLIHAHFSGPARFSQDPAFQVFSRHVINANLYARSPHGTRPFLYHPGDIVLAGRRKDVLAFFDVPPATSALMDPYGRRQPFALMRRVPEQYFWMHCIRQLQGVTLTDTDLILTPENRRRADRYYVSNFYPRTLRQLGVHWQRLEKEYRWKDRWLSVYLPEEWQRRYQQEVLQCHAAFSSCLLCRSLLVSSLNILYRVRDRLLRNPLMLNLAFRLAGRRRQRRNG